MNTAVNVNVVHESEAQRQHARVKLPARIRYIGSHREGVDARLLDLSAGGFAFTSANNTPVQVGDLHKGKLLFQIDSISFSLEVEFQVRSYDRESARVGCEFQHLKPREIAALRYLITSYLAGEVVSVGDMLNTLQRENFTKARKHGAGSGGMGFFGRFRAVTVSTAIFVVGVGAFAVILNQIYNLYFVTHADSGVVSVANQQITMPREGTVESLVEPGAEVAKGAPIASFSANLLDLLKGNLTEEQLNPSNIEKLFGHQMKGTLTSPCDCRVVEQRVANGQFANKGDVIFTLTPRDSTATVEARFPYRNAAELSPGTHVNFQVAGDSEVRGGRILRTAPVDGDLSSEIRVQITPDQPLDSQMAGRPTEVSIGGLPGRTLLNKAMALATAR
ncbi:alginate biosynthesis protein Alg44 [Pseudomonas sp. BGr12]|uniref:alginate biosynthesis protein Alg44 n=1 Tax=unclassified Pseudomonas TaxID=196821 RepID=UPI0017837F69|nr:MULTISPECIES: HlyD family efflux transporter periplasmic adaptor subunit [unclassified Pseudomonas]MDF3863317.1 HlyD family efflux transporter periplasmic adaptor subunit [Pseudomonas denitrificans (nom. rej.)]MBD9499405.1 HlyD family efflux transporter periplasmic adaptor subunit [Pseudomonas sp. PDM17]MBD9575862.1 HlyD family efflux transporter periplasmic adaptor subunit [Pseudomonas sp. PDM23]MBD9669193.1 HlyD family efflux transporter periplasmic adaptor subunit [Pseudomonas sp. PDM21]